LNIPTKPGNLKLLNLLQLQIAKVTHKVTFSGFMVNIYQKLGLRILILNKLYLAGLIIGLVSVQKVSELKEIYEAYHIGLRGRARLILNFKT
jgi:hypothetical protein